MENLTPQPINQTLIKSNSLLIIVLSVLLIITISIAGFFAYQTQKLVKEITTLQIAPTPLISIEPSPTATCVPLPSCVYNMDPNYAKCTIGLKPPEGGSWCPRGCTKDLRICPDGSAVGRSGPNCEFPSCPKPQQ